MKRNIFTGLALLIFPIAFIAVFFLIAGTEHGATCWMGVGFLMLAYAIKILAPLITTQSRESYIMGLTTSKVTTPYFIAQFVYSLILMIGDFEEWKIPLVIEIILSAGFIGYIAYLLVYNERTAVAENKREENVAGIKALISQAKSIYDRAQLPETKKYAKAVYDEINSCPSRTTPELKELDNSIAYALNVFNQTVIYDDAAGARDSANKAIALIKMRKEQSKY